MRPFIKPAAIIPRPTKASLARNNKIRNSIVATTAQQIFTYRRSLSQVSTNTQNNGGGIQQNNAGRITKRRRSASAMKLTIISETSMNSSTKDGETLKQVIVSSLTENVKKMDLVEPNTIADKIQQENIPPLEEQTNSVVRLKPPAMTTTACQFAMLPKTARNFAPIANSLVIVEVEPPLSEGEAEDVDDDLDPEDRQLSANREIYVLNYIRDIMNFLYALEQYQPNSNSYLHVAKPVSTLMSSSNTWKLTPQIRTRLISWLTELFYFRFCLSQDSLHLCIQLLDRFFQHCSSSPSQSTVLTEKNLKLIGVATLLIAAKVEETQFPSCEDLVVVTDKKYSLQAIKKMEKHIINELNFELNRPTSLQFLRRYSFASGACDEQHSIGKYFIDLALYDFECMNLKPSIIAASATFISRFILSYSANRPLTFEHYWPEILQKKSPYKTFEDLSLSIKLLANLPLKITRLDTGAFGNSTKLVITKEYESLYRKYEHRHLSSASVYCVQQQKSIMKLANGSYL